MSVRISSSNAAVRPAGPAPIMIAFFCSDMYRLSALRQCFIGIVTKKVEQNNKNECIYYFLPKKRDIGNSIYDYTFNFKAGLIIIWYYARIDYYSVNVNKLGAEKIQNSIN